MGCKLTRTTHLGLGRVTSEFFLVLMLGTVRLTDKSSAACFSSMTTLVVGVSGTSGLLGLSGDICLTPSTSVCVCVCVCRWEVCESSVGHVKNHKVTM